MIILKKRMITKTIFLTEESSEKVNHYKFKWKMSNTHDVINRMIIDFKEEDKK